MRFFLRSGGFEVVFTPRPIPSFTVSFLYRLLGDGKSSTPCEKLWAVREEVGCRGKEGWLRVSLSQGVFQVEGGNDLSLTLYSQGVLSPGTFQDLTSSDKPFYTVLGREVFRVDVKGCRAREAEGRILVDCRGLFSLSVTPTGWGPKSLKHERE